VKWMPRLNQKNGLGSVVVVVLLQFALVTLGASSSGCVEVQDDAGAAEAAPPAEISTAYFAEESCCADDTPCQDGLFCNGREICNCWGECEPADPLFNICADGDRCTSDLCDETLDTCPHTPLPGPGCACTTSAFCNDGNACTTDVCNPATMTCSYAPLSCDDGNICTTDTCDTALGCVNAVVPSCCRTNADCDDSLVCTTDVCAVATGICTNTPFAAGSSCSDGNWCNGPEVCNATGLCLPGTGPCGLSCEVCDVAPGYCRIGSACYLAGATNPSNQCESCQPLVTQTAWSAKPVGTGCNDGLFCTLTDQCNGAGACVGSGARCPLTGCVGGCDDTPGVDACTPVAAGTVCEAAAGSCATDGVCNGTSLTCPGRTFLPSTTICRPSGGVCDVIEYCTGSSAVCPSNSYVVGGTSCRASAGICDLPESCTGSSAACPTDLFLPNTSVCRTSAGVCDVAENCTGSGAACPGDSFLSGTICRASAGECDVAETCPGTGTACPANGYASSGTVCTDDTNVCTRDVCDGVGACTHPARPDGATTGCSGVVNQCTDLMCQAGTCTNVVSTSRACTYTIDACYSPGVCLSSGLCGPSATIYSPANDLCSGIITVSTDAAGDGSVSGSTACAANNYSGSCGGGSANDVTYRYSYSAGTSFQLYSYNVVLRGSYNTVLYAEGTCGSTTRPYYCNDTCVDDSPTPLNFRCSDYGLSATDAGFSLQPPPTGTTRTLDFIVDGAGVGNGTFTLQVDRVNHQNWRCAGLVPVDATSGGTYRGNNVGFSNNVMCGGEYTGNPCDCNGADNACGGSMSGASTGPVRAWFSLRPAVATTYCAWTDETAPTNYFDTVIEEWDPSCPGCGCPGTVVYQQCRRRALRTTRTQIQFTVPAGGWRMVAVSPYWWGGCAGAPAQGNDYELHIDIGACP
jgi:hypothetical protein